VSAYVLVAEDDPKQAELVRRYLVREEHTVRIVTDGRAAIDEVRRTRPDLLVLDVMMPGMGGLDVCRVLRRDHDLPVLMVTARAGADDKLLGFDLGADDYLTKPYDPRELMARVRHCCAAPSARCGSVTWCSTRCGTRCGSGTGRSPAEPTNTHTHRARPNPAKASPTWPTRRPTQIPPTRPHSTQSKPTCPKPTQPNPAKDFSHDH
jgi:CheY-like chemotaxis protein